MRPASLAQIKRAACTALELSCRRRKAVHGAGADRACCLHCPSALVASLKGGQQGVRSLHLVPKRRLPLLSSLQLLHAFAQLGENHSTSWPQLGAWPAHCVAFFSCRSMEAKNDAGDRSHRSAANLAEHTRKRATQTATRSPAIFNNDIKGSNSRNRSCKSSTCESSRIRGPMSGRSGGSGQFRRFRKTRSQSCLRANVLGTTAQGLTIALRDASRGCTVFISM